MQIERFKKRYSQTVKAIKRMQLTFAILNDVHVTTNYQQALVTMLSSAKRNNENEAL